MQSAPDISRKLQTLTAEGSKSLDQLVPIAKIIHCRKIQKGPGKGKEEG
jgi:hypothetical protein